MAGLSTTELSSFVSGARSLASPHSPLMEERRFGDGCLVWPSRLWRWLEGV